jgi:hypothetical protein
MCVHAVSETTRQPRQQRLPSSGACSSSETSTSEQRSRPLKCESLQLVASSVTGHMVPAADASLRDAAPLLFTASGVSAAFYMLMLQRKLACCGNRRPTSWCRAMRITCRCCPSSGATSPSSPPRQRPRPRAAPRRAWPLRKRCRLLALAQHRFLAAGCCSTAVIAARPHCAARGLISGFWQCRSQVIYDL